MNPTDEDLIRSRLQGLPEPGPLDPDRVLAGSVHRAQRRSLLTAAGIGIVGLGTAGLGLTWWQRTDTPIPANPTTSPTAITPTSAPPVKSTLPTVAPSGRGSGSADPSSTGLSAAQPWPTGSGPMASTLYLVSGTLALQVDETAWAVWDALEGIIVGSGDWATESIGSMVVNRLTWRQSPIDELNHYVVVLPLMLHQIDLRLNSQPVPVTVRSLDPVVPGSVLSWTAQPPDVDTAGGFDLRVQVAASDPTELIRLR